MQLGHLGLQSCIGKRRRRRRERRTRGVLDAQRVDEARREMRQQRLRPAARHEVLGAADGREATRAERQQVEADQLAVRRAAAVRRQVARAPG